jgi:hypothetical protein
MQKARTSNNQLLQALVIATSFTGFADLSKITICLTQAVVPFEIAVSLGFGLAAVLTIGQAVSGLDLYLQFRDARLRRKGSNPESENVQKGVRPKIKVLGLQK